MKSIAMLMLAVCSFAAGQEQKPKEPQPPGLAVKVFALKHASPHTIRENLALAGVVVTIQNETKMVVVKAQKELMPAVEEIVNRLDVPVAPAKNIELTVHLLQASQQAGTGTVPADLQPVIKQLKSVFNYQEFQVLDTLFLRTREGQEASASGVVALEQQSSTYLFSFREARIVPGDKDRLIRIDRLRLAGKVPIPVAPGNFALRDVGINADIDVREGQKVVVGKTGLQGSERALILVLSAKVVD